MQTAPPQGFRRFVQTGAGRALLLTVGIAVVVLAYSYTSPILAIPAILVVGLALPIYFGLKRPRYLAVSGLVIILLVAPLATLVFTQYLLVPVGAADSSSSLPDGAGGAVLQNATVSPFNGGTSTSYAWTVTVYPQYLTSSLGFAENTGTYAYEVGAVPGYVANAPSGNATLGTFDNFNLTFARGASSVNFTESTLPVGTNWSVTLNGTVGHSVTSSIVFNVTNGVYPYRVATVDGYSPVTATGSVTVSGATPVAVKFQESAFPVHLGAIGLPAGVNWSVALGAATLESTGTSATFYETNATYSYTFAGVPGFVATGGTGSVTVNGAPIWANATFSPTEQSVTFTESGLTAGTTWYVTLGAQANHSSTGPNLAFLVDNGTTGTFDYSLRAISGFAATPSSGTVTLLGTSQIEVSIAFAPTVYQVAFTEGGLPVGTPWSVTLGGVTLTTYATPVALVLYLTTCPGATTNDSPVCSSGYPLHVYTHNFTGPLTGVTKVTIGGIQISTEGVWTWQMAITTRDAATGDLDYVFLVGDPTYDSIEGPVVGSFTAIYTAVLPTIYLDDFLFLGLPFYFVLLLYMILKGRERRRNQSRARAPGPIAPAGSGAPGSTPPPSPSPALPSSSQPPPPKASSPPPPASGGELACPNCGAVVYASEASCWKCGSALGAGPAAASSPPSAGGSPPP